MNNSETKKPSADRKRWFKISFGDRRFAPPISTPVSCQQGLRWPGFVFRHLAVVLDTSTFVWQKATLYCWHSQPHSLFDEGTTEAETLLTANVTHACLRAFCLRRLPPARGRPAREGGASNADRGSTDLRGCSRVSALDFGDSWERQMLSAQRQSKRCVGVTHREPCLLGGSRRRRACQCSSSRVL